MAVLNYLFQPITIGNMVVKNRLVMPPMGINFGVDENGCVTEQLSEYFLARAKGGTGMMLLGGAAIHPSGLELPKLPRVWDDKFISALQRMTEAVHQYDVKFGVQLMHGGRQSYHGQKVAPSPIPAQGVVKGIPKELTVPEIIELIGAFGDAARRCKQAGFDFVEVHAAHGYLINEFMAPNSNKRQDQYGGSFENRVRFLFEVFKNVKENTGTDFPVGIRINGDDYIQDGWTIEDTKRVAPLLEEKGAAYIHVTAGIYGSYVLSMPSMYIGEGCFVHLAEEVKKQVRIPVITVGRIRSPEFADRIIKEGKTDMVSMGRAHLADAEIANKAKSGRLADIRPCIGCCLACINNVLLEEAASCVMNPEVNREYILKKQNMIATTPRKVMVIGAGPAGLAFARTAALRGHKVLISEEKGHIGGMLRLAAVPPGRSELLELIEYYSRELNKLNVEIRLNASVNKEMMDAIDPDVLVIATGSLPKMPQLEGLFDTEMEVHTVVDILNRTATPGNKVIVLGGNQAGLEVADFLAEKGKEIVVLHRDGHFATEMAMNDRYYLRGRLNRDNVRLYRNVTIKKFLPSGVIFVSKEKEIILDHFEDIVLSEGMRSVREVADWFKEGNIKIHIIGDAKSPRNLLDSQTEAFDLAISI